MAHYTDAEAARVRATDMDEVHEEIRRWAEQHRPEVEAIIARLRGEEAVGQQ